MESLNLTDEVARLVPDIEYAAVRDQFSKELTGAANGEASSLPFIHNRLPDRPLAARGETFQVFVIGGTNGETATVRYNDDGSITIVDHQSHPELAKFATAQDFLHFIDGHVADATKAVGINFAFTLIPETGDRGQLDGKMVSGDTKGHAFAGLQGQLVGATIEQHFKETHHRDITVSVGNDTVCLIAAMAKPGVNRKTLAAGIVGTGYNLALFLDEQTIINVQASDFTGFTQTPTGTIVDRESTNVGEQRYNKEVAAGELYKHYNALVEQGKLAGSPLQSGKELADLAIQGKTANGAVARALLARSASLVAAHVAGFTTTKAVRIVLRSACKAAYFGKARATNRILSMSLRASACRRALLYLSGLRALKFSARPNSLPLVFKAATLRW